MGTGNIDPIVSAALEGYRGLKGSFLEVIEYIKSNALSSGQGDHDRRIRRLVGSLKDSVDSLITRARQAPQLVATWGPERYIIYLASKAADLSENTDLYKIVLRKHACPKGNRERIPSTGLGYALYARALAFSLAALTGDLVGDNIILYLIGLVREGSISPGIFQQVAETLSRLIVAGFSEYSSLLEESLRCREECQENDIRNRINRTLCIIINDIRSELNR